MLSTFSCDIARPVSPAVVAVGKRPTIVSATPIAGHLGTVVFVATTKTG